MPMASWWPAAESDTAMPARTGPWPGRPVMLISPPTPWMIWSTAPFVLAGPSWP